MSALKIVMHFTDGRVVKGTTQNFAPDDASFHMTAAKNGQRTDQIFVSDLKAIFFVKSFAGRPGYRERKNIHESRPGRAVRVIFKDNERLEGTTLNYSHVGAGFFVFPADVKSNNEKIYVVNEAVEDVSFV